MTSARPLMLVAALALCACNDAPGTGCEDLASYGCYAEISPGCCTTESTPNAAVCRGGLANCPPGLLARTSCSEFAGDGCEAAAGVPGPGGVIGVCCPIADFLGCSPGQEAIPGGGWAPSYAECQYYISGFDGQPWMIRYEWGCPILNEDVAAPPCGSVGDAGPGDADAGAGSTDAGSGDAGADDAGAAPDCSSATRVDAETCTVAGCVPTTAPMGAGPVSPECVAVTADSCVVMCRRVAPPCPPGTYPEGDGSCYTDRCIPESVCVDR